MTSKPASTRATAARVALGLAALALALGVALLAGGSDPAGAAKLQTLGKTKDNPRPSCPGNNRRECVAVGSMTGFQSKADGENGVLKVPKEGHIVGWSVHLSHPNAEERKFFGDFYRHGQFGTTPVARIGIIHARQGEKYELKRQSPEVKLGSELGEKPVITLDKPLRVKKGDIVALTVPTWLPDFAVDLSRNNVWRASRSADECSGNKDIKSGRPQQKEGSARRYGCRYTTARLLYWAFFVPSGGGKDEGSGGEDRGGGNDGGGGGQDGGGGS